jgi:hypothetical protein
MRNKYTDVLGFSGRFVADRKILPEDGNSQVLQKVGKQAHRNMAK